MSIFRLQVGINYEVCVLLQRAYLVSVLLHGVHGLIDNSIRITIVFLTQYDQHFCNFDGFR